MKGEKYLELKNYLLYQGQDSIKLDLEKIEKILGFELPESARLYQEWWHIDEHHTHSYSWGDLGYKVDNNPIKDGFVIFKRN